MKKPKDRKTGRLQTENERKLRLYLYSRQIKAIKTLPNEKTDYNGRG